MIFRILESNRGAHKWFYGDFSISQQPERLMFALENDLSFSSLYFRLKYLFFRGLSNPRSTTRTVTYESREENGSIS